MTVFWFLFYAMLISLVQVQCQVPADRSQGRRHRNRGRMPMLEAVVAAQNVSGENQEEAEDAANVNARPETWRDLLAINNVTNLTDFISLLVTRDGQPVREEDLFVPGEREDGKRVIAGSGELLAESDECSPRNMSVRLDLELFDPEVAYYPECTRVERCGGCTPTPYLACVPLYKEIIIMSVLEARYPFPGALSMEVVGFAPVRVERHLTCRAQCTLKEEDCGPHRTYLKNQCRCKCLETSPCGNNKAWDEDLCECRCRNRRPCCGPRDVEGRRCPLFFDPVYCECTLKENVGGDPNATQAEMEAWLRIRRGQQPGASSGPFTAGPVALNTTPGLPPTTGTTATTPVPTTAETTQASCAHLSCPRGMIGAMNPSGLCVCQYPRRRMGQRRNQQG